jgi:hypothetical protein
MEDRSHDAYLQSKLLSRWRQEDCELEDNQCKVSEMLSQKHNTEQKNGSFAKVLKHLLSMCKALGSIPLLKKKRQPQIE